MPSNSVAVGLEREKQMEVNLTCLQDRHPSLPAADYTRHWKFLENNTVATLDCLGTLLNEICKAYCDSPHSEKIRANLRTISALTHFTPLRLDIRSVLVPQQLEEIKNKWRTFDLLSQQMNKAGERPKSLCPVREALVLLFSKRLEPAARFPTDQIRQMAFDMPFPVASPHAYAPMWALPPDLGMGFGLWLRLRGDGFLNRELVFDKLQAVPLTPVLLEFVQSSKEQVQNAIRGGEGMAASTNVMTTGQAISCRHIDSFREFLKKMDSPSGREEVSLGVVNEEACGKALRCCLHAVKAFADAERLLMDAASPLARQFAILDSEAPSSLVRLKILESELEAQQEQAQQQQQSPKQSPQGHGKALKNGDGDEQKERKRAAAIGGVQSVFGSALLSEEELVQGAARGSGGTEETAQAVQETIGRLGLSPCFVVCDSGGFVGGCTFLLRCFGLGLSDDVRVLGPLLTSFDAANPLTTASAKARLCVQFLEVANQESPAFRLIPGEAFVHRPPSWLSESRVYKEALAREAHRDEADPQQKGESWGEKMMSHQSFRGLTTSCPVEIPSVPFFFLDAASPRQIPRTIRTLPVQKAPLLPAAATPTDILVSPLPSNEAASLAEGTRAANRKDKDEESVVMQQKTLHAASPHEPLLVSLFRLPAIVSAKLAEEEAKGQPGIRSPQPEGGTQNANATKLPPIRTALWGDDATVHQFVVAYANVTRKMETLRQDAVKKGGAGGAKVPPRPPSLRVMILPHGEAPANQLASLVASFDSLYAKTIFGLMTSNGASLSMETGGNLSILRAPVASMTSSHGGAHSRSGGGKGEKKLEREGPVRCMKHLAPALLMPSPKTIAAAGGSPLQTVASVLDANPPGAPSLVVPFFHRIEIGAPAQAAICVLHNRFGRLPDVLSLAQEGVAGGESPPAAAAAAQSSKSTNQSFNLPQGSLTVGVEETVRMLVALDNTKNTSMQHPPIVPTWLRVRSKRLPCSGEPCLPNVTNSRSSSQRHLWSNGPTSRYHSLTFCNFSAQWSSGHPFRGSTEPNIIPSYLPNRAAATSPVLSPETPGMLMTSVTAEQAREMTLKMSANSSFLTSSGARRSPVEEAVVVGVGDLSSAGEAQSQAAATATHTDPKKATGAGSQPGAFPVLVDGVLYGNWQAIRSRDEGKEEKEGGGDKAGSGEGSGGRRTIFSVCLEMAKRARTGRGKIRRTETEIRGTQTLKLKLSGRLRGAAWLPAGTTNRFEQCYFIVLFPLLIMVFESLFKRVKKMIPQQKVTMQQHRLLRLGTRLYDEHREAEAREGDERVVPNDRLHPILDRSAAKVGEKKELEKYMKELSGGVQLTTMSWLEGKGKKRQQKSNPPKAEYIGCLELPIIKGQGKGGSTREVLSRGGT
eukprot:Cvel_10484.t1-p1 / transcript=Cvel_10484.t1 / gene=Cvel_10484 / organism=Chromera_velia_CCMP2878 / gene_product=hypothetical protein / transcript_product=hypothetical protein / location=Cvel_scaffold633:2008-21964(-) / protein_length=1380 / sequence_SO=supercontig / SO=protein_coding / is_pseudo=false